MALRSRGAALGVLLAVAAMVALCLCFKALALALFGAGAFLIERDWRMRHADFRGGIAERWRLSLAFYRSTHQNPTNRTLHVVGIPLIVGGALGLFASRPFGGVLGIVWLMALVAFGCGWLLNLVGHSAYEKRAPAFSEDALSFLAGPVWDLQQLLGRSKRHAP